MTTDKQKKIEELFEMLDERVRPHAGMGFSQVSRSTRKNKEIRDARESGELEKLQELADGHGISAEESAEDASSGNGDGNEEVMDFGWFVLHTLSGNEEKVRGALITTMEREGLSEHVKDVLIPVEDIVEVKRQKKRIKQRKLFPGYVFVRMRKTQDVEKQIRRLPNLARFVGGMGGNGPVPVTDEEIGRIRQFMTETRERPKIIYEVDEVVRIINGPFMDFSGSIQELDIDKGRLKIMVEIFGRATPVDLDFDQVEKV